MRWAVRDRCGRGVDLIRRAKAVGVRGTSRRIGQALLAAIFAVTIAATAAATTPAPTAPTFSSLALLAIGLLLRMHLTLFDVLALLRFVGGSAGSIVARFGMGADLSFAFGAGLALTVAIAPASAAAPTAAA